MAVYNAFVGAAGARDHLASHLPCGHHRLGVSARADSRHFGRFPLWFRHVFSHTTTTTTTPPTYHHTLRLPLASGLKYRCRPPWRATTTVPRPHDIYRHVARFLPAFVAASTPARFSRACNLLPAPGKPTSPRRCRSTRRLLPPHTTVVHYYRAHAAYSLLRATS